MLSNVCAVSLLLASIALVSRSDLITKKYTPDHNRIIKRLHGSPHAKLFLHGCDAEPYINLTANTTTESEVFELQKSKEYLFAIFTLHEISLILSNGNMANHTEKKTDDDELEDEPEVPILLNITLGINKNSVAMMEVFANETLVGNVTQRNVPLLPTIPYYVNVSITENNISVYEARTKADEPFMFFDFALNSTLDSLNITTDKLFVKFRHSSPIFAHYDCCEACTPWVYTRISGCSKYSVRTASSDTETTFSLIDNNSSNETENVLFNQNIVVNHDGRPTFAAKIIFSEFDNCRGNRYEIGLSDTPTIFHYYNSSAQYTKTLDAGVTLKRQYTSPFIVNITITKNGIVSLRQPYEERPFLAYVTRFQPEKLTPVNVKYMTLVKFHEDFIRYDFFYNCTDLLWFTDKHEPSDEYDDDDTADETDSQLADSYPRIWEYVSKQFNATRYDVLHVFQDSYQIYEKSSQVKENTEYDDPTSADTTNSGQTSDKIVETTTSKGFSELIKKTVVGIGSFLMIGLLKMICSLDCVKNLMRDADVDDEKAKEMRKKVSKVVNMNVAEEYFGIGN